VDTVHITNVYVNRTVIVNNDSHVAFNGGEGGVAARPTAQEETYARETHTAPVAAQVQQEHAASQNKALFASENHGAPAVAATAKPGEFSGRNVVAAKAAGAPYHAPAMSPKEARASAPAENRSATPNEANRASTPAASSRDSNQREENARPAELRSQETARPAPKENASKAKPKKQAPPKREGEKGEKEK